MRLSDHAKAHIERRQLRSNTITRNVQRFERLTGITEAGKVSIEVLNAFRDAGRALGLSPVTIEKTVTDTATVVKVVLGTLPAVGDRIRQPRPKPAPPTHVEIDAIFAEASPRLRRWLAITYWTGARISDSIYLYVTLSKPLDVIRHTAKKTGLEHVWPVPSWLHAWFPHVEPRPTYNTEYFGRLIRDELAECCTAAKVPVKTPKNIRQASITEWTSANATAGAMVHGSGLGVMACYLDPLSVLTSAMGRVRVPSCFGSAATESTEDALLCHFRRLDPAAQGLITGTAERLAAG